MEIASHLHLASERTGVASALLLSRFASCEEPLLGCKWHTNSVVVHKSYTTTGKFAESVTKRIRRVRAFAQTAHAKAAHWRLLHHEARMHSVPFVPEKNLKQVDRTPLVQTGGGAL